jgi:putative FmdB family regulatory protein
MPLYEYRCEACGEKEEKLEGFSAPTEHDCALCGKPQGMQRQISLTSFTLAGGGWEAQGYGKGAPDKTIASTSIAPPAPAKTEGTAAATPAATPAPAASAASGTSHGGGCACHPAKQAKPAK